VARRGTGRFDLCRRTAGPAAAAAPGATWRSNRSEPAARLSGLGRHQGGLYRFFDNDRVSEAQILAGHFAATASRVAATEGPILILHDTTEFVYHRVRPEPVGVIGQYPCRNVTYDRRQFYTVCGLLMHSSLGVTPDGLPLGLCAVKFWTRANLKGSSTLKRHINPTRVPIEQKESLRWLENMRQASALVADPARCIHIGDRESDIYELFVAAHELGTHFLVRSCVDRLTDDGARTLMAAMEKVQGQGEHRIDVRDDKGKAGQAQLTIKYHRLTVRPPLAKQRRYPALELAVICADEQGAPENVSRSIGASSPICPSPASTRQLKSSVGTPCAGRSRWSNHK